MSRFWSNIVSELTPYIPGEQPKLPDLVKLNTNENPYGPSPHVLAALHEASNDSLRLYPDPTASELKQTLADYHGLNSAQVFVGNGSDEVLALAFMALLKHDAPLLFPDISYSFYPVYCKLYGIDYRTVALDDAMRIRPEDYQGRAAPSSSPIPTRRQASTCRWPAWKPCCATIPMPWWWLMKRM